MIANKVFYHDDLDGKCSAAAIKYLVDPDAEFYSTNYNKEFPMHAINKGDNVWILDYSTSVEQMQEIQAKAGQLIWIDHHASAIERFKDSDLEIEGVRDSSDAACVLTWRYLLEGTSRSIPGFVELIGDMDAWHWNYGEETRHFVAGMQAYDTNPNNEIWGSLYSGKLTTEIVGLEGIAIDRFLKAHHNQRLFGWGYLARFEGQDVLILNDRGGSFLFGEHFEKYPFVVAYIHDGEAFNVSLYSTKTDVKVIAEKYGGGGHVGAAGFRCATLPFTDVISLNNISI